MIEICNQHYQKKTRKQVQFNKLNKKVEKIRHLATIFYT